MSDSVSTSGAPILPCEEDEECEMVSCQVCLTEVPKSVAKSYEGPDYVYHFCGHDCFEKWRKNNAK